MNYKLRKIKNIVILSLSLVATGIGLFFLGFILFDLISKGFASINIELFTVDQTPPILDDVKGGLRHAFIGQIILTVVATLIAVPLGLLGGTYLAEYGRNKRIGRVISMLADISVSMPSIIVGTFVYAILVKPLGGYNGYAGAVALAIIMLPVITRTTEEMLKLVPWTLREAAFALGASYNNLIVKVVWRGAATGIFTGILLAIARVAGETAPLLFTSFNNTQLSFDLTKPMPSLTVSIYQYASSPYSSWINMAWAAALIITVAILILNLIGKLLINWRYKS